MSLDLGDNAFVNSVDKRLEYACFEGLWLLMDGIIGLVLSPDKEVVHAAVIEAWYAASSRV